MSRTRVVATFAVRSEPQWLVDDLMANLRPWVHDFAVIDNREQRGGWHHEGELNARKRALCEQMGATWVLFVDPDERIEDRTADGILGRLESGHPGDVYGFEFYEMWTPTQFRVDGDWGRKLPRHRLFRLAAGQVFANKPIHCGIVPAHRNRQRHTLPWRLYHLKNIEPRNRVERAAAYTAADPEFRHQRREGKDWSWLHDETGLELRTIEPGRGFTPPYSRPYLFTAPGTADPPQDSPTG